MMVADTSALIAVAWCEMKGGRSVGTVATAKVDPRDRSRFWRRL